MSPIAKVILWTNGMVMVFNVHGQQMTAYQGMYGEVKDKILAAYSGEWILAEWEEGVLARFNPRKVYGMP